MATVNEEYFDAQVRHQVGVRRFASGEVKQMLKILKQADQELAVKLRKRLAKMGGGEGLTERRIRQLMQSMRETRGALWREVKKEIRGDLSALGPIEADFEKRMIEAVVPFDIDLAAVDLGKLRRIATSRPFQGRHLRDWFGRLQQAEQQGLQQALRMGMTQGEGVNDIVRRVIGTRSRGFTDGVLATSRRNAEAVVRTAVNHVSNRAREDVWDANADIIQVLRWTATLDGRTSAVCRGRDGRFAPVGNKPLPEEFRDRALSPPRARPPAHINCRSLMVAQLDSDGLLGERPFVRDTRTRRVREIDFRKIAKEQGRSIQSVRKEWGDKNIGRVPAETDYQSFLKRQPTGFQDDVLGTTKGKLFRKGDLTLDKFVDRNGTELTISQLRKLQPDAFIKAGLD